MVAETVRLHVAPIPIIPAKDLLTTLPVSVLMAGLPAMTGPVV